MSKDETVPISLNQEKGLRAVKEIISLTKKLEYKLHQDKVTVLDCNILCGLKARLSDLVARYE